MTDCPTPQRLEEWLAGALPDEAARAVEAHLTGCPGCAARVRQLLDNPSLRRWVARPPPPPPGTERAALDDLLARLRDAPLLGSSGDYSPPSPAGAGLGFL